jgi:UDP-3-O-[3-hydroxymyristoyl] glucosamine N-acyltransferase
MNLINPFFKNKGPFKIKKIIDSLKIDKITNDQNFEIIDIKDLFASGKKDISFLNSSKYRDAASATKSTHVITNSKLINLLPKSCNKIIVDNVLTSVAIVTELFYPNSINDDFDDDVKNIKETNCRDATKFGKNVLMGKNVKIGKNFSIGHNSIIESNVVIGDNCSIGSNVIIRKTLIGNNVKILDGSTIGKKGFGFFPKKNVNVRYPHIGVVIINDNVEIGCGNTIDRGSLSNTIIGKNTFIDNQVHIAHNVKIGDNCIIAGQVGFAGSSTIGHNVMIGGQSGISGHLKIGNNVQIGGGSGVIKDIPDNTKVMGYPAKDIKSFIKENK